MSSTRITDCLELKQIDCDAYTNVWPPWLPPGAQNIFGGALVAHALVAAHHTVPTDYVPRSMQCTFVSGGRADVAITYRIERLADDVDNVLRTVRAYQHENCIFMATLRFRLGAKHERSHSTDIGASSVRLPFDLGDVTGGGLAEECPYICSKVEMTPSKDGRAENADTKQWMSTRKALDAKSGGIEHIAALAYMSDNYILPTASRAHGISWARDPEQQKQGRIKAEIGRSKDTVALMVTLNHSIYFNECTALRADDWLLTKMRSPWAGEGRTLVNMNIFDQNGRHLATAIQEGVLRLAQHDSKL